MVLPTSIRKTSRTLCKFHCKSWHTELFDWLDLQRP